MDRQAQGVCRSLYKLACGHADAIFFAIDGAASRRRKVSMKGRKEPQAKSADDRKARLAEALRTNLMKRKAQSRSRRAGAADARPDGLVGSLERKED